VLADSLGQPHNGVGNHLDFIQGTFDGILTSLCCEMKHRLTIVSIWYEC
jgi:hypothetical protein